jgi:hypothetical protein
VILKTAVNAIVGAVKPIVMTALTTAPQGTELVGSPTPESVCGFKQVENQQGFNC